MSTLTLYHPAYNPTELVFNTMLQRLYCERVIYNSLDANTFLDAMKKEISRFTLHDVKQFYRNCDYNY